MFLCAESHHCDVRSSSTETTLQIKAKRSFFLSRAASTILVRGGLNLLLEGRTLQNHLPKPNASKNGSTNLARTFLNLMFQGKTSAALQLLTQNGNGGVLHVNDPVHQSDSESQTVLDILKSKHPQAQPASPDTILWNSSKAPQIHPVICDQINASSIRSADLRTKGAAGPSGIDAYC